MDRRLRPSVPPGAPSHADRLPSTGPRWEGKAPAAALTRSGCSRGRVALCRAVPLEYFCPGHRPPRGPRFLASGVAGEWLSVPRHSMHSIPGIHSAAALYKGLAPAAVSTRDLLQPPSLQGTCSSRRLGWLRCPTGGSQAVQDGRFWTAACGGGFWRRLSAAAAALLAGRRVRVAAVAAELRLPHASNDHPPQGASL